MRSVGEGFCGFGTLNCLRLIVGGGSGCGSLVWAYDVYGDLCSIWVFNGMTTALWGDLSRVIGSGVSTSYICTIFPQFSLLI